MRSFSGTIVLSVSVVDVQLEVNYYYHVIRAVDAERASGIWNKPVP